MGALGHTTTANIIFESKTKNFEKHKDLTAAKLFKAVITKQGKPLYNIGKNFIKRKHLFKIKPALSRITEQYLAVDVPISLSINSTSHFTYDYLTQK